MELSLLLLGLFALRPVWSCTIAQISGSLADRIAESENVVWGYVVATEHDQNKSVNGLRVYHAEVRVKCVMKGQVMSRIKVVQLGDASRRCVRVDLQLNQNYILLLNKVPNSVIEFTADVKQDLFSRRRLDKVTSYCDVALSQPMNEAYTEHGYVDCSSFSRRGRRKRPCTTLPKLGDDDDDSGPRTGKKERKTTERRHEKSPASRKNRLDTRQQGDRPHKEARDRRPAATKRPRTVVIRPRKSSAAMNLRTRLTLFFIVIAYMFDWL